MPCTYDLELSAAKYFYSLPDGEIPLTFHFSGTILHSEDGKVQIAMVPWSCSARYKLPVDGLEADDGALLPGRRLGAAADRRRSTGCRSARPRRGCRRFDACVAELLDA